MEKDKIAVNVSKDLYELVKQRVKESIGEFKDVEDYVEFVLREVAKDEETEEQKCSKEDEELIEIEVKEFRLPLRCFSFNIICGFEDFLALGTATGL